MAESRNRAFARLAKDVTTEGNIKEEGISSDVTLGGATVYATRAAMPMSGNTAGDQAYVTGNNRLYIWNGSGWYNVALLNLAPSISSVADSDGNTTPFTLSTEGAVTTITITAADSDGDTITYTASADSDFNGLATLSQDSSVFTITPFSEDSATTESGTITFTATDGINNASSGIQTFTLSFKFQTVIPLINTTTPSSDQLSFTLIENDGSFGGSAGAEYYAINSRSTAANRLRYNFDGTGLNNFDNVAIQFEYYWLSVDNFGTTFHSNRTAWRTNRGVVGGQSGGHLSLASPTASSTWPTPANTWLPVEITHNRLTNTGYLKINGTKVIDVTSDQGASTTYTSNEELCFAQFFNSNASDNGIDMRIGVVQVSGYNGDIENDIPAYNGRFT